MEKWLALIYKLPAKSTKTRVYIWRKFKKLRPIHIRSGVSLFPNTEESLENAIKLRNKILEMGGEASVNLLSFIYEEDEKRILGKIDQ